MNSIQPDNTLSRRQYWGFVLLVIVLATIVTAWFTRPLLSQITTSVPGRQGDAIEHLWTIWWFEEALTSRGQSPAALDILFYPSSINHPILSAGFWARTVSIPVSSFFGPVFAYNAHLFLAYVLTWLFMSLLCLELTGSRKAALIGGAIFTYFANRTMHVFYGHWTIALLYPVPLLILTFWRLMKRPSIWRALAFSMALVMSAALDLPPLAQLTFPILTAVLLFFIITRRKQMLSSPTLKYLVIGFGLAALLLTPVMWPLVSSAFTNNLNWYQEAGVDVFSADLLAPFVPPSGHPLTDIWPGLRALSEKIYSYEISITESVVYVSWPAIVLAGLGVAGYWHKIRDVRLWFTLASILAIFALGPLLRVAGKVVTLAGNPIILPYLLLMKTPLFSWGRTPARFYLAIMFALAILAAYGVNYLLSKSWVKRWSGVATAVILAIILYDSKFFPEWPMVDLTVPPYYAEMAADTRSVAVLDIPALDYWAAQYHLLYQMTHKHVLVGGHNYRFPSEVVQKMSEIEALARSGRSDELAQLGIGYVVLHRKFLDPAELGEYRQHLTQTVGQPTYQDAQIIVFTVSNAQEIAPRPLLGDVRQ